MRKINQHKSTYYKELGAIVTFLFITFLLLTPIEDQTYTRENHISQTTKMVEVKEETMEQKIVKHFPKSHVTMIAIAKAESGMRNTAVNYNCYYNDDMTIVYETKVKGSHGASCKKGHEKYSFGVDCFVLQAHYEGRKSCPTDVTLDQHLEEMAKLSKVRSFQPWVSYNRGLHEKYLANK